MKRYGNAFNLSSVPKSWKIQVCGVLYQRPRTKDRGEKEQHDQRHALSIFRMGHPKRKDCSVCWTYAFNFFRDWNNYAKENEVISKCFKKVKKIMLN